MYIDKLDDIANKYNNTCHSKIKKKSVDVKSKTYINSSKKIIMKILNLELVILLKYQNIKIFMQKTMVQIGLKKILVLQKLKILLRGEMLLVTLKVNKLLQHFTKENCKKRIKKGLELKK